MYNSEWWRSQILRKARDPLRPGQESLIRSALDPLRDPRFIERPPGVGVALLQPPGHVSLLPIVHRSPIPLRQIDSASRVSLRDPSEMRLFNSGIRQDFRISPSGNLS